MLKTGKYRALRNIPVGWTLQALHSTDLSERIFRIMIEFFLLILFMNLIQIDSVIITFSLSIVVVHTITWLITGNFWVYMLDSFKWVKNPGITKLVSFIQWIRDTYIKLNCCDAILIYGSMCRNKLHIRSDLDLRIVRRGDSKRGLLALIAALFFRFYSLFKRIPVDLQVVDSMTFLNRQMRSDEHPIVVYQRLDFELGIQSQPFAQVEADPQSVLKMRESDA